LNGTDYLELDYHIRSYEEDAVFCFKVEPNLRKMVAASGPCKKLFVLVKLKCLILSWGRGKSKGYSYFDEKWCGED